ncbi:hypothetical protein QJS10_CPA10g01890 [Acorus calamus]|uniref:KEN domain-containing protein n=1 Tax=Acorus calamus TaxID=4465 RepID=A0AAV9E0P4_ACOCL|nr:hypothetical protein QJS10_CPA10g01890 [Acorus calamus]
MEKVIGVKQGHFGFPLSQRALGQYGRSRNAGMGGPATTEAGKLNQQGMELGENNFENGLAFLGLKICKGPWALYITLRREQQFFGHKDLGHHPRFHENVKPSPSFDISALILNISLKMGELNVSCGLFAKDREGPFFRDDNILVSSSHLVVSTEQYHERYLKGYWFMSGTEKNNVWKMEAFGRLFKASIRHFQLSSKHEIMYLIQSLSHASSRVQRRGLRPRKRILSSPFLWKTSTRSQFLRDLTEAMRDRNMIFDAHIWLQNMRNGSWIQYMDRKLLFDMEQKHPVQNYAYPSSWDYCLIFFRNLLTHHRSTKDTEGLIGRTRRGLPKAERYMRKLFPEILVELVEMAQHYHIKTVMPRDY